MSDIDLLVCIRCHKSPHLILDTVESVVWASNAKYTKCVVAVDGVKDVANEIRGKIGNDRVFCSEHKNGWGIGLFLLLIQSINYFKTIYNFSHFMTIDYDTLFIAKNADLKILNSIVHSRTGLMGRVRPSGFITSVNDNFKKTFGIKDSFPYGKKHVQGGCMTLTNSFLNAMSKKGMLTERPFSEANRFTSLADDHFLPILCEMCDLDIVDLPFVESDWVAKRSPLGLEMNGIKIFHPINMKPKNQGEKNGRLEIANRNYFRKIRGSQPL